MTESDVAGSTVSGLMLTVRLGEDLHAIPIQAVEEVLPALPVESVPNCPAFVRGVVFVRGHLIPVLDAAERLGLVEHQRPVEPPIVCLRIEDRLIGVEFDEALDLVELDSPMVLPADVMTRTPGALSAIVESGGRLLRILDPNKLIESAETAELERVPRTAG